MDTATRERAPTARYALDLLVDRASRLLLLRRAPTASLGAGRWGLPAGGIEAGETPLAAACREMDEEIGATHEVELLRSVGPFRDTYYGGRFEIHLFHFRWLSGEITLNEEHTEYAWVRPERYRDYDVMDGIDEDIAILGFWPRRYLDPARIPVGDR